MLQASQAQLVETHIGYAGYIASRYAPSNLDEEDSSQAACCGLVEAARRFDVSRNVPFTSFSVPYMRGAMRVAANTRSVKTCNVVMSLGDINAMMKDVIDESPMSELRLEVLRESIAQLAPEAQEVMRLRYGLGMDDVCHSRSKVARLLKINRHVLRAIETAALVAIRQYFQDAGIYS